MAKETLIFNSKPGTFINSIRAYRKYKEEWRTRMETKLSKMEEQIRLAKADPFYKVEAV